MNDIQKCVCSCDLLCSIAQLSLEILKCFHVISDGSREGAELVISCNPARQEVHVYRMDERFYETAKRKKEREIKTHFIQSLKKMNHPKRT